MEDEGEEGESEHEEEISDEVKKEIFSRAFLSHKRTTGQKIAGRLYQGLSQDYTLFLDSAADFDLHDLQLIVEQTMNFIFILTEGILESEWCIQGKQGEGL